MRTFAKLSLRATDSNKMRWILEDVEPHVAIRLKNTFPRIPKSSPGPFAIDSTDEAAADLLWFSTRYALAMSPEDAATLEARAAAFHRGQAELALLLSADRAPRDFKINGQLREYQARGVELYLKTKRLLIGDAVGIGKTLQGIGSFTEPSTLPALVVVQAHLPTQWAQQIVRFLGARFHIMKGTKPYPLPPADVYITTYSRLAGWVDVLCSMGLKSAVFDEIQELRREDSQKYQAAQAVASRVEYCLGLSATPIYNYGDEIFNIFQVIKPGALGEKDAFEREWCRWSRQVVDPKALGAYLREQFLFLRRTRDDVKRELPPVNKIVHTVGHDEEAVQKVEDVARALATRVTTGSFQQRGEAARELDMMMRMITGVSKAKYVAEYVRILLENGEPVLLVGWHRDVYEIWLKELAEFKPVMYTGSESASQKDAAKWMFTTGKTNLMIMSLRSGIGLDGLQHRCRYVVFGELDWSPAVHDQVTGRIDRDGQENQVTSIYLVSDGGSDPLLVDTLGIKASQAAGIVDPFGAQVEVHSDGSRIKALAEYILRRRPGEGPRPTPAPIAERLPNEQVALLEGL
jgi:SNF2 family DNA or RNA helicase